MKMNRIRCSHYLDEQNNVRAGIPMPRKEQLQRLSELKREPNQETKTEPKPEPQPQPVVRDRMIRTNCMERKYVPFPYFFSNQNITSKEDSKEEKIKSVKGIPEQGIEDISEQQFEEAFNKIPKEAREEDEYVPEQRSEDASEQVLEDIPDQLLPDPEEIPEGIPQEVFENIKEPFAEEPPIKEKKKEKDKASGQEKVKNGIEHFANTMWNYASDYMKKIQAYIPPDLGMNTPSMENILSTIVNSLFNNDFISVSIDDQPMDFKCKSGSEDSGSGPCAETKPDDETG